MEDGSSVPVPLIAGSDGSAVDARAVWALWVSASGDRMWTKLPDYCRGAGAPGALLYANLAAGRKLLQSATGWSENMLPGAILQMWPDKAYYDRLRGGGVGDPNFIGHSCIFLGYTDNRNIIRVADQHNRDTTIGYGYLGLHYIIAANLSQAAILGPAVATAPRELSAVRVDDGARLQWLPPADTHGLTIRSYWIDGLANGKPALGLDVDGSSTSAFVSYASGLLRSFRVCANTDAGEGEWSDTVPADNLVATPPGELSAVRVDDGAQLQWLPPADTHGLTIRSYSVESLHNGVSGSSWIVTNPVTTSLFANYASGLPRSFRVRANTDAGEGEWSDAVPADNLVATPPGELSAVRVDDGAQLQWLPPADTHGLTIRSYSVESLHNGVSGSSWIVTNPVTTSLFANYASGLPRSFRVRANTDAGEGEWSDAVPADNLVATPPRELSAVRVDDDGAQLQWLPPADTHGLTIRSYSVESFYNGVSGSSWIVTNPVTTSLFANYASGLPHSFRVRANTDAGEGEWSDTVAAR